MIVCNCTDLDYDDLLELVRIHGNNLEEIMNESDAGTICESCLEDDCKITDIPLKDAISKAMAELNN
jgi:NAD(P)H-nitrite reductase large subunit